jgi:VWFA-related protein
MEPLTAGTVLQERYKISNLFGSTEWTAAYLADDQVSREQLLIWESGERFKLVRRPPGARDYFTANGKHYLTLRLEGQSLAFMLAAAGRLSEMPAGLWLLQICRAIGYWHNREEGPLVCLRQGKLSLSAFHLTGHDQVMVPAYGNFSQVAEPELPAEGYQFSAPETGDALSPRSDVYALGAMLYCLLAGQPAPEPEARVGARAVLVPPQRINRALSSRMEKIVLRALQLDPKKRYPTAAEMADALEQLLIPQLMSKKKEKARSPLWMRLVPFMVTFLALVCLVVAIQGASNLHLSIKLPWLDRPTPTSTPVTPVALVDTPTPTVTPTPTPTAVTTPRPDLVALLNQVRLDQFPQVIAYSSVLDENREPVRGLTSGQFRVQQDGVDVADFQVANVDAAQDPLAMVVAIDISGSMKGEPLEKAKAAASNFVGRFDALDQVALIKFDDRIELVHDFTTDKNAVIGAIGSLRSRNDTALYDVIAQSVERLSTLQGRRAVIVLTDGRDTASTKHQVSGAIAAANGVNIPVFVIGLDSYQFTPEIMAQIAAETGGDYLFAPTPDALDALYQKIRGQLQNQYRIDLTSLHGADQAMHTLRIGLDLGGGFAIWAEKSYRAP